jgi:hypothetical protein
VRRFHLHRLSDEHGKSGVGIVAEGVLFTDGSVSMRWLSATPSIVIFNSLKHMQKVHGHGGVTKIIWRDE